MRRDRATDPAVVECHRPWLTAADVQDADYWCEHMCGPVRFEEGAGELLRNQEQILLEVGPGAGLGAMVRQHAGFGRERMGRVLPSLPALGIGQRIVSTWPGYLGRLWLEGAEVDWEGYYAGEARQVVICRCLHSKASRRGPSRNRLQCKKLAPCLAPTRGEWLATWSPIVARAGRLFGGHAISSSCFMFLFPNKIVTALRPDLIATCRLQYSYELRERSRPSPTAGGSVKK